MHKLSIRTKSRLACVAGGIALAAGLSGVGYSIGLPSPIRFVTSERRAEFARLKNACDCGVGVQDSKGTRSHTGTDVGDSVDRVVKVLADTLYQAGYMRAWARIGYGRRELADIICAEQMSRHKGSKIVIDTGT